MNLQERNCSSGLFSESAIEEQQSIYISATILSAMKCQNCDFLPEKEDHFCRKCGCELPQKECFRCDCGADVLEEDNYCHQCGASFTESFCACGSRLPQSANYCPNCGTPIERMDAAGEKEVETVEEDLSQGSADDTFQNSPPSSQSYKTNPEGGYTFVRFPRAQQP